MWILIAFVAAIGLTALAVMAVFGEFGSASSSQTAGNVVTQVSAAMQNILTDYAGNPNFANLTNQSVYNTGAAPKTWGNVSNSGFSLPGGGTASFAPASVNGGTDNGFAITVSNLGGAACANFGPFYTPNMASVSINGTTATNPDYNGGTNSGWPPALASDCNTAGSNTVTLTVAGD